MTSLEDNGLGVPHWLKLNTDHLEGEQHTLDIYKLRETLEVFGKANGFTKSEIITALQPRWLRESYPGMEADMAKDLHSSRFWREFGDYYEKQEFSGNDLDRAVAEAYSDSAVHANTLKGGMDRVFTLMMWKIRKTGLYMLLSGEHENIREWLLAKLDAGDISDSERSNVLYLLEEFLPALDSVNFDPDELLLIPEKWTAARAAVPHLRRITQLYRQELEAKEALLAETEKKNDKRQIQKEISSISSNFEDEVRRTFNVIEHESYRDIPSILKGESKAPQPDPIAAGQLIKMPDETYWLIVPCPNKIYLSMIQKAISKIVKTWEWRGPMAIVQNISDMLLGKEA